MTHRNGSISRIACSHRHGKSDGLAGRVEASYQALQTLLQLSDPLDYSQYFPRSGSGACRRRARHRRFAATVARSSERALDRGARRDHCVAPGVESRTHSIWKRKHRDVGPGGRVPIHGRRSGIPVSTRQLLWAEPKLRGSGARLSALPSRPESHGVARSDSPRSVRPYPRPWDSELR